MKEFFENLTKVSDLVEYDGPLLSYFISDAEENYLLLFLENVNFKTKWLAFKADRINQFILNKIDLLSLMKDNEKVYIIETKNSEIESVNEVLLSEIPTNYLPEPKFMLNK